jgi:hypothetical protein
VLKYLRIVLLMDAVVLSALGLALLIAPHTMWTLFGFGGLPPAVNYIVSMWGALMCTMGLGYFFAAREPSRSTAWVWAGLLRGVLEAVVGLGYLSAGLISFAQAWAGLFLAVWFALAYIVFFPRRAWLAESTLSGSQG